MTVSSRLTFEKVLKEEEDNLVLAQCWIRLTDLDKQIEEGPSLQRLRYDKDICSRRYHNLEFTDLFEHYMDSYNIKVFKLYEALGYVPNVDAFKDIKFKIYDLLECVDTSKTRDTLNIDVHVVVVDDIEIGYLVLDGDSDADDLANFYFVDEEMAKKYFRIYFGNGKFEVGCQKGAKSEPIMASEIVPKPFDIDILLSYYDSIEDVVFDRCILLFEYHMKVNENSISGKVD